MLRYLMGLAVEWGAWLCYVDAGQVPYDADFEKPRQVRKEATVFEVPCDMGCLATFEQLICDQLDVRSGEAFCLIK